VSVGTCASLGKHVGFVHFPRFGLPITPERLVVGAVSVIGLTLIL
jgi:hypothetical protein